MTNHRINDGSTPRFDHGGRLVTPGSFMHPTPTAPAAAEAPAKPPTFAVAAMDASVSALDTFRSAFVSPHHLADYLAEFRGADDFREATGLDPDAVQRMLGAWFDADRAAREAILDPGTTDDFREGDLEDDAGALEPGPGDAYTSGGLTTLATGGLVPGGAEADGIPAMARSDHFMVDHATHAKLTELVPPLEGAGVNVTVTLPGAEGAGGEPGGQTTTEGAGADPNANPGGDAGAPAAGPQEAGEAAAAGAQTEGAPASEAPGTSAVTPPAEGAPATDNQPTEAAGAKPAAKAGTQGTKAAKAPGAKR